MIHPHPNDGPLDSQGNPPHGQPFDGSLPEIPAPIPRTGLPTQPTWILSILVALASVMTCFGICALCGALPAGLTSAPAFPVVKEIVSILVILLLSYFLFRVCRTMRWAPVLLLVLAFIVASVATTFCPGQALTVAVILISALFATGMGSLLIATAPRSLLSRLPLIPLAAYAVSVILCLRPAMALAALLPFPAAVALALGTRSSADPQKKDGLTRVGVLCLTSLMLGLGLTAVTALALYHTFGSLSPELLLDGLENLRTVVSDSLKEAARQMDTYVQDSLLTITDEQITDLVNSLFNVLPALLVVLCNLLALLAQTFLLSGLSSFGYDDSVKGRVRVIRMSLVSAAVFLLAWLATLIFGSGDSSTLPGTVAQNIAMILNPGLALCGLMRLLRLITRNRRGGCLTLCLLILLPIFLLYASSIFAFYEAVSALLLAVFSRVRGKPTPGGDGGSSDGGNEDPFGNDRSDDEARDDDTDDTHFPKD